MRLRFYQILDEVGAGASEDHADCLLQDVLHVVQRRVIDSEDAHVCCEPRGNLVPADVRAWVHGDQKLDVLVYLGEVQIFIVETPVGVQLL